MSLYPFKFNPRFVEKIWGGRKIETVLGKKLPPGKPIGESWEIYDFPPGIVDKSTERVSSIISNGVHAGRSLHWAVTEFGKDLLADVPLTGSQRQFPLLIKFLDAREDLSVQVHPDQKYADEHPSAHLKTEAWYVLENAPGARLFKGLQPNTTRDHFQAAIASGNVEKHLGAITAKPGQCHYLPSGTIHALGAGILVAEVQTPSDTTFRVFDFNRVEPSTGKARSLHIEQAMQCIDFSPRDSSPKPSGREGGPRPLVDSPFFKIIKRTSREGAETALGSGEPAIWIFLEGSAQVKVDGVKDPVRATRGDTLLMPAALKHPVLKSASDCTWLEVRFR